MRKFKQYKQTIFLNANKPLIWKMRTARFVHWHLRTKGALNEWRYHKLLGWELNRIKPVTGTQLLHFILLRAYSLFLSWRQLLILLKYKLIVVNDNWYNNKFTVTKGDIIEIPFILKNTKYRQLYKKKFNNLVRRAKRFSYKYFKARKKKIFKNKLGKIYKRIPAGYKQLGYVLSYDPTLNLFAVMYQLPFLSQNMNLDWARSSVLTLQNWRYRFD